MLNAQKAFIELASNSAQPGQKEFAELLGPQGQAIQAVMEAKDKLGRTKDGREWGACLSVVAEGIPAWGWVQIVCPWLCCPVRYHALLQS
jgi:adenylyl cyclase-associated protein